MKLRTQTTKRANADTTSSTIVTPVKQRRIVNEINDTMKTINTTQNISTLTTNTSTGFKTILVRSIYFIALIQKNVFVDF